MCAASHVAAAHCAGLRQPICRHSRCRQLRAPAVPTVSPGQCISAGPLCLATGEPPADIPLDEWPQLGASRMEQVRMVSLRASLWPRFARCLWPWMPAVVTWWRRMRLWTSKCGGLIWRGPSCPPASHLPRSQLCGSCPSCLWASL